MEIKELEDIFNTKEFKSLSWGKRLVIRLKVAFIQTISMY
jgi:hypothetical protein